MSREMSKNINFVTHSHPRRVSCRKELELTGAAVSDYHGNATRLVDQIKSPLGLLLGAG